MHRPIPGRTRHGASRTVTAAALIASLALLGCGSDDAGSDATDAPAATDTPTTDAPSADTTEAAPATTEMDHAAHTTVATTDGDQGTAGAATAGYEEFCAAEIAVEAAVGVGDPAVIGSALEALSAAAPADAEEITDRAVAEAQAFTAAGEDPSPEFLAAYAELIQIVKDHCGFAELDVLATNYQFGGLPPELPAGPAVITFVNDADEFHELALFKKNDGVTESVEELVQLPEEEAMSKVQMGGGAFAAPGTTTYTVVDFTAGDWAAVCFLPVGSTEEAFAEAETTGSFPEGEPHFTHGMLAEFVVS